MKRIGIIFAMEEELQSLLKIVELKKSKKIYDITFYECTLKDKNLILAESGIGKVNAARCTQILIDKMNVDLVINMGVAGSVTKDVKVCDVVIGEKLVQHDFDITAFNHEKGYVPKVGVYVESDPSLVKLAEKIDKNAHKGVIASGDIFCTDKKMSNQIYEDFHALCVEMEGASIAQVCYLSKIPFLVIRSISDSPDGSDNKLTYDEFLQISSERAANFIKEMILKIES